MTPAEAFADPHVQARGYFKMLDYPGLPRPAHVAADADTPLLWTIREHLKTT